MENFLPCLILFTFITLLTSSTYSATLQFPITKEYRSVDKATFLRRHPHNGQAYLDRMRAQRRSIGENVDIYDEIFLSGWISVGTPPQSFYVEFNELSTDFWVANDNFTHQHGQKDAKHKFKHSKSQTFIPDGRFYYESFHESSGVIGEDILHMGDLVVKVSFGMVHKNGEWFTGETAPDGVFGLSLDDEPHVKQILPSSLNLIAAVLNKPIYTLWTKQGWQKTTGVITFGSEDKEHCQDDFVYVPLDDKFRKWTSLYSIQTVINGKKMAWDIPKNNRRFELFMGGMNFDADKVQTIVGDSKIILDMYKQFNVTKTGSVGLGEISCKAPVGTVRPNITLVVGNRKGETVNWVLKPEDYIIKMTTKRGKCAFIFYDFLGEGYSWALGDLFPSRWCTAYNFKSGSMAFGHKK